MEDFCDPATGSFHQLLDANTNTKQNIFGGKQKTIYKHKIWKNHWIWGVGRILRKGGWLEAQNTNAITVGGLGV